MIKIALLLIAVAIPPAPSKYVTDAANVLDDAREHALNERLAQLHREETAQILVYVDRTLPANTSIEEFGAEAIRKWAPGTAKKDNGAILLLFIDDRASRIEVGYGLEEKLTDAKSKRILVSMRDALRGGDYTKAVEDGANAMSDVALGRALPAVPAQQPVSTAEELDGCAIAILVFSLLFTAGFVLFFVWLARRLSKAQWTTSSSSESTSGSSSASWSSSWSPSDSSSSSSSDSSSSYDGGGGSGGGGGASDKW